MKILIIEVESVVIEYVVEQLMIQIPCSLALP